MTFGSSFGRTFSPTFQPSSQAAVATSTFVPTDISGLSIWFDFSDTDTLFTDAGSTKVSSDGDKIYQANDKSGNNTHVSQATDSKRPLYKTNVQNSKSAGLSVAANSQDLNKAGVGYGNGGSTIFCVCSPTVVNTTLQFTEPGYRVGIANLGKTYTYGGTAVTSSNGVLSAGNWYILSFSTDANGNVIHYVNGTSVASGDMGSINLQTRTPVFSFASAIYWSGYIGELIGYSGGALSDTNKQSVETYLNNKWAIY